MIQVKIENWFQKGSDHKEMIDKNHCYANYTQDCEVKPYDMEKWRDGKIYEFKTLKEAGKFMKTCDIDFTEEFLESNKYVEDWVLSCDYYIDPSEDNLIIFTISAYPDY